MYNSTKMKKNRLRLTGRVAVGLLLIIICGCAWKSRELYRFYKVVTLFDKGPIIENFRNMSDIFPYHDIKRGGPVFEFARNPQQLPESFSYNGEVYNFDKLMKDTWTTGLIIIKDDQICFEEYYLGHTPDALHISWSVGKSFVSAMIGIAISEGKIEHIHLPVSDLVPRLKETGYDGISLKDVLQMSSGVQFNEDYADFHSDINRMGRTIALGRSINEFAASLTSERQPGKFHHYVSMDTQVLGMVLQEATGMTPSAYLEEKIWKKIGMQADARWLVDDYDMELVFGALNVTLRDYARFGRLYMNGGNWNGEQIVPEQWVVDSTTPDSPHLQPGDNPLSSSRNGYGFQWWIPEEPAGDFIAKGVYGQYIYVNPEKRVVIVKNSADPFWGSANEINLVVIRSFQNIAEKL